MKNMVSILLPAYNEEEMVNKACEKIALLLEEKDIKYEILLVDDGSKDATWKEIQNQSKNKIFQEFWKRGGYFCWIRTYEWRMLCYYGL